MRSVGVIGASDGVTLKSIQRTDGAVSAASASSSLDTQDTAKVARYNS